MEKKKKITPEYIMKCEVLLFYNNIFAVCLLNHFTV